MHYFQKTSTGRKYRIRNEFIRVSDKILIRFEIGDLIWLRNSANGPKWIKGNIERKLGTVLYEIIARGWLIRRHVDQIRHRDDDHTPDSSTEPEVPPILPTNTEKSFPNKLNENLSSVSTTETVHPPVTSPARKDYPTHPTSPLFLDDSSTPNLADVRNDANASTDSSIENGLLVNVTCYYIIVIRSMEPRWSVV